MNNIDGATQARIKQWLGDGYDQQTINSVKELINNEDQTELIDAFYKELEFGTGGLRGIMGVGSNRINKYTVGKATQGLANYLIKQLPDQEIKVAIAYDSRNNSDSFGKLVADVFSANGIIVYLFEKLRPTPLLSFAVRHFNCQAGVMLTASHNPKEYNGYKAYWNDGGQLVAPHDHNVITEVNAIESINKVKFNRNEKLIKIIDESFDEIYICANKNLSIHPELVKQQEDLKIVFSSIHGTGITLVPKILKAWGFKNIQTVEQQDTPNGNFPTVIYPNPEEEEAMSMAIKKGKEIDADIVMATDPDSDRVGLAVKNNNGEIQLLNGNQIASLLVYYLLSSKKDKNALKPNDFIVKTIVTSNLLSDISKSFAVKHYDTLTGFKFIGELITKLDGKENYLVGGEESYGYLVGDLVRDKDAINSCAFIAEMTAYFKSQNKSLFDVLLDIYVKHGFYLEKLISLTKKGKAGATEIENMMIRLRQSAPYTLGGVAVKEIRDYKKGEIYDLSNKTKTIIDLPKSDVLQFITVEGDVISARPSGTEPKIKFYCSVKETLRSKADFENIKKKLDLKVKNMMADIINE
ncbi:phospho-sugar mutase [Sphingobacterium sp. UT-1RO-CII-1]|uniref:phospho-sugar mutase n=1 Tax=Sphingobacterium sp. UT-1RO-CII-1 TaxID=2995225 RepID=UPI00227B9448|nr:phospho-sugar mutase [Sphingobacterium sp. UT-1RO-CII-1]MCY4778671.1 phospho-sugar mutase [Sphingobacterium sp. UT-1RO-CII-1]